jgi:DNA-binding HxlR family transcriptional regulator
MNVETRDETVHRDAALVAAFSVLGKRWNGVLLGALASG